MNAIARFALAGHQGPPELWPTASSLLMDGAPCGSSVPGRQLLAQFEIADGFLLVTNDDCPYEEEVFFVLVDRSCRVSVHKSISAPYVSYLLERIDWRDDRHCIVAFAGVSDQWEIEIRPWGIPFVYPQLKLTRISFGPTTAQSG